MELIPLLIILISALFLLLIPLAFIFVAFFSASIKTKRIVQIVATVMLALATVGVGFLWMMLAVVGAFQAGHHETSAFPMVVYYSPLFITGLWIVNLIVFLRDTDISMFKRDAKRIKPIKRFKK